MNFFRKHIDLKRILAVLAVMILAPVSAIAADEGDDGFMPTSAWLVGPASLSSLEGQTGERVPCVVADQFANGYLVRLSGGDNQLMAMAIDFRQKIFTPREKYDVEFSMPDSDYVEEMSGAAYDEATLLFGLQKHPNFYTALRNAQKLSIRMADTTVTLNLAGLDDGFARMDACYGSGPEQADNAPAHQGSDDVAAVSDKSENRQNPLIGKDYLTPMPGEERLIEQAVGKAPKKDHDVIVPGHKPKKTPEAQEEEQLASLAEKAKAAEALAKDLVATNPVKSAEAKQQGVPMASGWTQPRVVRPNPTDIIVDTSATPISTPSADQPMRWRALKGSSLRDVMALWSKTMGVKMMWLALNDFPIQKSLSLEGRFDQAVQSVLEQYSENDMRPVGRIYRDPETQQIVLVIEQDAPVQ